MYGSCPADQPLIVSWTMSSLSSLVYMVYVVRLSPQPWFNTVTTSIPSRQCQATVKAQLETPKTPRFGAELPVAGDQPRSWEIDISKAQDQGVRNMLPVGLIRPCGAPHFHATTVTCFSCPVSSSRPISICLTCLDLHGVSGFLFFSALLVAGKSRSRVVFA